MKPTIATNDGSKGQDSRISVLLTKLTIVYVCVIKSPVTVWYRAIVSRVTFPP